MIAGCTCPATRKVRRIPASDRGDYFLGTDFTYEDIQSEFKLGLDDYDFSTDGTEMVDGVPHYRLSGKVKSETIGDELGYGGFRAIVDGSNWLFDEIVFLDPDLEPLKTVTIHAADQFDGVWCATDIQVVNHQDRSPDAVPVPRGRVPRFAADIAVPVQHLESGIAQAIQPMTLRPLALLLALGPAAAAAQPVVEQFEVPVSLTYGYGTDLDEPMLFLFETEPRLDLDVGGDTTAVVSARLRLDAEDDLEPGEPAYDGYSAWSKPLNLGEAGTLELRDAYLETYTDWGLLRVGKQQIVWGRLDGLKVLDVLNPQTFREFILPDLDVSRDRAVERLRRHLPCRLATRAGLDPRSHRPRYPRVRCMV